MDKAYLRAVMADDVNAVTLHLGQGNDPNEVDAKGSTALHYAVFYGSTNVSQKLIQSGADVNARVQSIPAYSDSEGRTNLSVLQVAALNDQIQCARILIDHGADIEAKDENGVTALWEATEEIASVAVARLLVERGADINSAFPTKVTKVYEGDERYGRFNVIDELVRENKRNL